MRVVVRKGRRWARTPVAARVARCLGVSVLTTAVTTAILVTLAVGLGVAAAVANVAAVATGTAVSYVLNRRWVWRRAGRSSVTRGSAPFWLMNFAGLVVSTLAVHVVGAATIDWSSSRRALALPAANLAAWGALWIVQFVLLERVIFGSASGVTPFERDDEPLAA